jgi:hypothetical protein
VGTFVGTLIGQSRIACGYPQKQDSGLSRCPVNDMTWSGRDEWFKLREGGKSMTNQTGTGLGTVTMSPTGRRSITSYGCLSPLISQVLRAVRPSAVGMRAMSATMAGLVLAMAASGCGGSGVKTQTGPPPSTSPPSSATPTSSPHDPTGRESAATAATAQARRYESVLDELSIHTHASLNQLNDVATEPNLAQEVGALNRFREVHDRQAGLSKITGLRIDRVRLPAVGTHSRHDIATAHVSLCLDVTHVRAYGPSGHSIVPKSRKPYFLTSLTLVNRNYPSPSGWLVSDRTDREVDQCSV